MYYLYKHNRLDNGNPFYIGIGTKNIIKTTHYGIYKRAYTKHGRSKYWQNIVTKYGYKIEIIYEHESLDIIKQKEIDYVKLYGRLDLKTGILVNLTDGGDGANFSNEKKQKLIFANKNRVHRKWTIEEKENHSKKLKEVYKDPKQRNRLSEQTTNYFKTHNHINKGIPRSENIKNILIEKHTKASGKPVLQYDLKNNLIEEFPSTMAAQRSTGCRKDTIRNCANGKSKTAKNFIWKWKIN